MLEHVLRAAATAADTATASDVPSTTATGAGSPDAESADGDDPGPRYVLVLGHQREQARAALRWAPSHGLLTDVVQEPQLGTGDAVRTARAALTTDPASAPATILVLYGDTPLVRAETLSALLAEHERTGATLTFLTGMAESQTDYGRVLRDGAGRVAGIVEARHATPEQLRIPEVNSGIYCFAAEWLWSRLDRLEPHPNGEYYLTDLVALAVGEGRRVSTASAPLAETLGVNDRLQLAEAERALRERLLRALMLDGVTVLDPATTYVEAGVRVGPDTVLRPGTILAGTTVIGAGCTIGPNSMVRDSQIGDDCLVLASWVEEAVMEAGSRVGPMSHLRPGARLTSGSNVGNFGEVKNATLGHDVQMHHFSYIGDANIGDRTNVAAGTITSNFAADGKKYHTEVGEDVFIGSDTILVAPITLGTGALTGAGSVVRRDVPPFGVAVGVPARVIRHREPPQATASGAAPIEAIHGEAPASTAGPASDATEARGDQRE